MTTINRITEDDVVRFLDYPYMDVYQEIATKSAFYPGKGTALGLIYVALKMNGEAGELAEHVGKAMRDDYLMPIRSYEPGVEGVDIAVDVNLVPGAGLTQERRLLIIKEIGDVLWYVSAACNELGITLAEAAEMNLAKLKDRTDRKVLGGSGDER